MSFVVAQTSVPGGRAVRVAVPAAVGLAVHGHGFIARARRLHAFAARRVPGNIQICVFFKNYLI